jgi:hypothetical protein
MSKKNHQPIEDQSAQQDAGAESPQTPQPAKRTKQYTFPDIDGGGPSVTIEATSIEEATALYQKGQA